MGKAIAAVLIQRAWRKHRTQSFEWESDSYYEDHRDDHYEKDDSGMQDCGRCFDICRCGHEARMEAFGEDWDYPEPY